MDSEGDDGQEQHIADNKYFVSIAYLIAFLPWVVYGVVDHVDGQWRKINDLRQKTWVLRLVCYLSTICLFFYYIVQTRSQDWKEGNAALVVLFAAWLPGLRLLRQQWLLSSSRDLGDVLHSLPNFEGYSFWGDFKRVDCDYDEVLSWDPGNSNKFFDNDDPGEGVTDVNLFLYRLQLDQYRLTYWHIQPPIHFLQREIFFIAGDPLVEDIYKKEHYDLAMHLVTFRLRILVSSYRIRPFDKSLSQKGCIAKTALWVLRAYSPTLVAYVFSEIFVKGPLSSSFMSRRRMTAENGLTRSLWLYENLTGQGQLSERRGKLAQVLHLGLVVHVGMVVVQGFTPVKLNWVNLLAGTGNQGSQSENVCRPSYGHLRTRGLLLEDWFSGEELKWFQKEDFDEVFAKLPTERCSLKKRGHLRWENITFMACSTIELHAFVVALCQVCRFATNGGDTPAPTVVDTVWKYIAGAFAANRCIRGDSNSTSEKKLHAAVEELPDQYKTELQHGLIGGPNAVANWNDIIVHCGNMVDVVTNALRREPPPGRQQILMPENLRDEDWRIQLSGIRDALVGTLRRLLPSCAQLTNVDGASQNADMGATPSGSASEAASASVLPSGAGGTDMTGAPPAS